MCVKETRKPYSRELSPLSLFSSLTTDCLLFSYLKKKRFKTKSIYTISFILFRNLKFSFVFNLRYSLGILCVWRTTFFQALFYFPTHSIFIHSFRSVLVFVIMRMYLRGIFLIFSPAHSLKKSKKIVYIQLIYWPVSAIIFDFP